MKTSRLGPPIETPDSEEELAEVADLRGRTIISIDGLHEESEQCRFADSDGVLWTFFHEQDCCECVDIAQVDGDAEDLIGVPLEMAEVTQEVQGADTYDRIMETFYKFATRKGYVTVRWFGQDNGFYSVDVSLTRTNPSA